MTKFEIKEKSSTPVETTITVKKVGRKYETEYFFDSLLEFALMTNGMSINTFLKTKENLSKTSFICYYNKS